ncbi:antibiotic biosynthesis monooxygenase [Macrococcus carouselicus]|uniref:Signal transduction protein TRAP n=1 Tax=Macrococcus carouselicus TaxID=69969 RepID=A0A9Q8CP12_9STAP|nr:hypothetical protein [Macrococcus carouselicus]TDM04648.1 hypothetical protein ERX40_05655 [Macrococcus carouselicus]
MNVYFTHGSDYYMERLTEKHPDRQLLKFAGPEDIVLYESTDDKSVFSSGEAYEAVEHDGSVTQDAPILLRYFQVSDEKQKIAESTLTDHGDFSQYSGYQSYQLLRPHRGQTYIALFQFSDLQSLEDFQKSSAYRNQYDESLKQYQSADFISNVQFTKLLRPYTTENTAEH